MSFAYSEAPPLAMLSEVGIKFQGHFHHIPLSPNLPLMINNTGPPVALNLKIIIASPLNSSYKYEEHRNLGGLLKVHEGREIKRVREAREREREGG